MREGDGEGGEWGGGDGMRDEGWTRLVLDGTTCLVIMCTVYSPKRLWLHLGGLGRGCREANVWVVVASGWLALVDGDV